jgi:hypothetical protein
MAFSRFEAVCDYILRLRSTRVCCTQLCYNLLWGFGSCSLFSISATTFHICNRSRDRLNDDALVDTCWAGVCAEHYLGMSPNPCKTVKRLDQEHLTPLAAVYLTDGAKDNSLRYFIQGYLANTELNEACLLCFSLTILSIQRDISPIGHLRSRGLSACTFKTYSLSYH